MTQAIVIKTVKLAFAIALGFGCVAGSWRVASLVVPAATPASERTPPPTVLDNGDQKIEFVVDHRPATDSKPLLPPDPKKRLVVDRPELHQEPIRQAEDQVNRPRPRIDPITQFDHGPYQGLNCTMASGAMLLELAAGIVTTGSALRSLQHDFDGGTDLLDLQNAVDNFDVKFKRRSLTPHELRQIMYAGAGAVIQGVYSFLGQYRDGSFRGPHAIYLDGFVPPDETHASMYYVIDPIATNPGYRGRWVPAGLVETFGMAFGNGSIYTSWAFPGNDGPPRYPELPSFAEPGQSDQPQKPPFEGHKTTDKELPKGDSNADRHDSDDKGPPVIDGGASDPDRTHVDSNVGTIEGTPEGCVLQPVPPHCPNGILGDMPPEVTFQPIGTGPPDLIEILYAVPISPDDLRVIFTVPRGSLPELSYWQTDAGRTPLLRATSVKLAAMDGQAVGIATMSLAAGASYQFVAGASATGAHAVSSVGAVTP